MPDTRLVQPYLKIDTGLHVDRFRPGVLFRSAWGLEPGLPVAVSDPLLKIDMRGPRWVTKEERELDHSHIAVLPVEQPGSVNVLGVNATATEYTRNYIGMLETCGDALASVVTTLAEGVDSDGCVLGCSIGRDRTGMVLALVQRALGVPLADVLRAEESMRGEAAAFVESSPHGFEGMSREEVATRLRAAHEPLVEAVGRCEEVWGGTRGYLRAHGVPPQTFARLERKLGV